MNLEEIVLMTLSFYEPMTMEKIILDLDMDELVLYPDFSRDQLEDILNKFCKNKTIKKVPQGQEDAWIRNFPSRKWSIKSILHKLFKIGGN